MPKAQPLLCFSAELALLTGLPTRRHEILALAEVVAEVLHDEPRFGQYHRRI